MDQLRSKDEDRFAMAATLVSDGDVLDQLIRNGEVVLVRDPKVRSIVRREAEQYLAFASKKNIFAAALCWRWYGVKYFKRLYKEYGWNVLFDDLRYRKGLVALPPLLTLLFEASNYGAWASNTVGTQQAREFLEVAGESLSDLKNEETGLTLSYNINSGRSLRLPIELFVDVFKGLKGSAPNSLLGAIKAMAGLVAFLGESETFRSRSSSKKKKSSDTKSHKNLPPAIARIRATLERDEIEVPDWVWSVVVQR